MTVMEDLHIDLFEMNKQLERIAEALDFIVKYLQEKDWPFVRPD